MGNLRLEKNHVRLSYSLLDAAFKRRFKIMKRLIIFIVCSAGLVFSGCATQKETGQYVGKGVTSVNRVSKSIIGAARAQEGANQEILDVYEKYADKSSAGDRAFFAGLEQKHAKQEELVQDIISGLTTVAIKSLPAGSIALKIAETVVGQINTATDKALTAANAATQNVKVTAEGNKGEISMLKERTQIVEKATTGLEGTLEEMKGQITSLIETKNIVNTDLAVAQEKFESLSTTIQEKLSKVPESVIVELTNIKANDAAFRERFQRQVELTDMQMEGLKGLSTTELLALLTAAGAGGVFSKTGKSRGAKDIEEMRKELVETNRKIDRGMGLKTEENPSE